MKANADMQTKTGVEYVAQGKITFSARILRKQANLPRYIVVRPEHLQEHTGAFLANVMLNGSEPFERNIRPWGKGSDVFFFNLTEPQCRGAGLDTNEECSVTIVPKE